MQKRARNILANDLRREGRSPTQLLFAAAQCCIDRLIVILNVGLDMYRYIAF
jgi:hypothetical protein